MERRQEDERSWDERRRGGGPKAFLVLCPLGGDSVVLVGLARPLWDRMFCGLLLRPRRVYVGGSVVVRTLSLSCNTSPLRFVAAKHRQLAGS